MLIVTRETEQLARLVAAKRGATPEDVLQEAVRQQARVAGVMPERENRAVDFAKIDAITKRSAGRPLLDSRPAKDILDEAWDRAPA